MSLPRHWSVVSGPKAVVRSGYDRIAERYEHWSGGSAVREQYVSAVVEQVPAGGAVLDLGCGTGLHATRAFAVRCDVIGVDISARSLSLARTRAPSASFVVGDMATVGFRSKSFDAVVAFFSLIHVPRAEHLGVLTSVRRWLRPGGVFVATMGAGLASEGIGELLGEPMYWSNFGRHQNVELMKQAGFDVVSAIDEVEDEDGVPIVHLWVVAHAA